MSTSPTSVDNLPQNVTYEQYCQSNQDATYEEFRQSKIQRNQQKLQEIGLVKSNKSNKSKVNSKKKRKKAEPTGPPRRSRRLVGQIPEHKAKDDPMTDEATTTVRPSTPKPKPTSKLPQTHRSTSTSKEPVVISTEMSEKLRQIPFESWHEDMISFMRYGEKKKSEDNIKKVSKSLERLMGAGVQHKETKAFFNRNNRLKITLATDLAPLYQDAKDWVAEQGGDRSNGWLLSHPINRMLDYQEARVNNDGDALYEYENENE